MPMKDKRFFITSGKRCLIFAAFLVMSLLIPVISGGLTAFAGTYKLEDIAGILSDTEEASVESALDALCSQTGYDFFAVSTDDNGGKGPRTFAEEYYNDHCSTDNGAVFLIDMGERTLQIVTAGKMLYYLTDERIDRILDHAYDYAADADYAGAYVSMITDTGSYMSAGKAATHLYNEDTGKTTKVHSLELTDAAFCLLLGFVGAIAACLLVTASYRMKFGKYRYDFRKHSRLIPGAARDILVGKTVTHRRIPRDDSSGGGGGRGHSGSGTTSYHSGAGGRSFGGGSRKF